MNLLVLLWRIRRFFIYGRTYRKSGPNLFRGNLVDFQSTFRQRIFTFALHIMLQLNHIRENKEEVITRLAVKNFDAKTLIENIITMDGDRRKIQGELDTINSEETLLPNKLETCSDPESKPRPMT